MRFKFHPEARQEYRESVRFYEARRDELGAAFASEIESGVGRIVEAPDRWPFLEEDVRRCLVHRFPYALIYTVEADFVLILAVMHCSRRPGYWRGRLPRYY